MMKLWSSCPRSCRGLSSRRVYKVFQRGVYGRIDRKIYKSATWMDGRMDGWMVAGWLVGWMDGWLAGWMDGWLAGWLDGWMMDRWSVAGAR